MRGRPTKLTAQVVDELEQAVLERGTVSGALHSADVPNTTFYRWIERGNPSGTAPENAPHRELRRRIEFARDEARNARLITVAAPRDWRAAAFLLERMYPERWALPAERPARR